MQSNKLNINSLESLMKRFIEKETGIKISKIASHSDMIKLLLIQEFGSKEIEIMPDSEVFGKKVQVIYSHLTTGFTIKYKNHEVDIITAEDNSGFLVIKTKLALDKEDPNNLNPYYLSATPDDYFNPLINFFDKLTGREKLIDFKYIPEPYQKSYLNGENFVFSKNHLWENNENLARQIVKDLYHQKFNSYNSSYFEPQYNEQYGSCEIKSMLEDFLREDISRQKTDEVSLCK